jgi:hypothetical protein
MKTANKRIETRLPKIHEITVVGALPEGKRPRRWAPWLGAALRLAAYWALEAPRITRERGPGLRPEQEHEWRGAREPRWIA